MNKYNSYTTTKEIHFTNHSTQRWNERVGPYASRQFLNELLLKLLRLKRIRLEKDYGIIDEDIVFAFERVGEDNEILLIKTVFGRISLKPQIANLSGLATRKFSLYVEEWLTACQQLPIITLKEAEEIERINARIAEKDKKFEQRLKQSLLQQSVKYNPYDYDEVAHDKLLDEIIAYI